MSLTDYVNAFNGRIEQEGDVWALVVTADLERRVISRHPTREAASDALEELNDSANRRARFASPAR